MATASPHPPTAGSDARFGEATPPAIFPPVLGTLGLGLAWRRAGEVFGVTALVGESILALATALYLLCLTAYLVKLIRRPGVLVEDVAILPGRAGLSAAVLCIYVLAAATGSISAGAAHGVLMIGFALHVALLIPVTRIVVAGPRDQRSVTPVWHLQFVGFIVGGVAATSLGLDLAALAILYATGTGAMAIWAVSAAQLRRGMPPPPLRPLLAIHLAPASLLGTVAAGTGQFALAWGLAVVAAVIAAALLATLPQLLRGGFNPLWSAFTFPLAAFAGFLLALASLDGGAVFHYAGAAILALASATTPPILLRVMRQWARGTLATGTGAARA